MKKIKDYLGDSVYAEYDGDGIVLTTDNGYGAINIIYLESGTFDALIRFVKNIKNAKENLADKNNETYKKSNCYECTHRREIPGDAHSQCTNPDPTMKGNEYGIRQGWFFYPYNYDPVWMTKECNNFCKIKS